MDFEQLANETFELEGRFQGQNPFESNWDESQVALDLLAKEGQQNALEFLDPNIQEMLYPNRPGLVYRIDNAGSTFCLRGLHTASIESVFTELKESNENIEKALRLDMSVSQDSSCDIYFFETRLIEQAEVLFEQFLGRRFPYNEELVCNLSDPGFSWWMENSPQSFKLSFKTVGHSDLEHCQQLGPIADRKIAALKLADLNRYFNLSQFTCSEKGLSARPGQFGHEYFEEIRLLFLKGEVPQKCLELLKEKNKTLSFYLEELAIMRSFWIDLSQQISLVGEKDLS